MSDEHDDNYSCIIAPSLEKATKATSEPTAANNTVVLL